MSEIDIAFEWHEFGRSDNHLDNPGRWTATRTGGEHADALFDFLRLDLEYMVENVEACIDQLRRSQTGDEDLCEVWGGDDGAAFYGNGQILIASDVDDDDRIALAADQFMIVLQQVRRTMVNADYCNPNNNPFLGFTVELIATGAGALEEYYQRGGVTTIMTD